MSDQIETPEPPRLELDPEVVEAVYEELGQLDVTLDADPLVYGPKRLNNKVAELRAMLSRCEALFLQVAQDRHRFSRAHRMMSVTLDLAKKHLYDKDPEVRAGRSVSDRDAIATGKLSDAVLETNRLELAVQDLDALLMVIKAKRADLRDAEGRLRDQMRLCSEEIGLGGRWGSKVPGAPELEPGQGRAVGADVQDVENLLAGIDAEMHLPPLEDGDEEGEEEEEEPTRPPAKEERPSLGRVFENMKGTPPDAAEVQPLPAKDPVLGESEITPSPVDAPDPPHPTVQTPWTLDADSEDEENPSFESAPNGGSFPSVDSLRGSPVAGAVEADNFIDQLESETDKDGKTRIGPLPDDVIESLLDSFL